MNVTRKVSKPGEGKKRGKEKDEPGEEKSLYFIRSFFSPEKSGHVKFGGGRTGWAEAADPRGLCLNPHSLATTALSVMERTMISFRSKVIHCSNLDPGGDRKVPESATCITLDST